MRKILLVFVMILSGFANANEMSNPCVYHPDLPSCAGNNRPIGQVSRVINIPNRWGAIYFNPVNRAVGYSENNTEGYRWKAVLRLVAEKIRLPATEKAVG